MNRILNAGPECPYCSRSLDLRPNRWFGRPVFSCEQCGDFPDYSRTGLPVASRKQPRPPRVLLIDDSIEHLELYRSMLDSEALVRTAARGEEGLAIAAAEPLDIVVLDVMMPGMDGWEVLRALKGHDGTASLPVVMLTSLDAVDVPSRARQLGAAAVLMKPCPVERLMLVVHACVRPNAMKDPLQMTP
jgi:CheY-like chemotaxis protein